MLFDEPLTVIDPALKWELRSKLKSVHRALDLSMIYVTHDQTEALTFADKVVVMNDGRAVQIGAPAELFYRPEHTFVGYFIGSPGMNFMPAAVKGNRADIAGFEVRLGAIYRDLSADQSVQVGVRPEFVSVTSGPGLPAQVRRVLDLGRKRLAHVMLGNHPLVVGIPREMEGVGDVVNISIDPANTHVYVADIRVQGRAP
jgi:glycerol transport system ATP-binding protein